MAWDVMCLAASWQTLCLNRAAVDGDMKSCVHRADGDVHHLTSQVESCQADRSAECSCVKSGVYCSALGALGRNSMHTLPRTAHACRLSMAQGLGVQR